MTAVQELGIMIGSQLMATAASNAVTAEKLLHFWSRLFFSQLGWTQGNCDFAFILDILIHCSHYLLLSVSFRDTIFEEFYKQDLQRLTSEKGWGSAIVSGIVSSVVSFSQYVIGSTPQIPGLPYLTLEITLSEMSRETEEWKDLGRALLLTSDINARKKLISQRKWSFEKITEICLSAVTRGSEPLAIAWWRLFFYRYFSFLSPTQDHTSGFFGHLFLEALGVSFQSLRERLDFFRDLHQIEGANQPETSNHHQWAKLYIAMKTWMLLDINTARTPTGVLNDITIENHTYLQQLIQLEVFQLRNSLHFSFHFEGLNQNLAVQCQDLPWKEDEPLWIPPQMSASQTPAFTTSQLPPLLTASYMAPSSPGPVHLHSAKAPEAEVFPDAPRKKVDVEDALAPPPIKIEAPLVLPHTLPFADYVAELKKDLVTFYEIAKGYLVQKQRCKELDANFMSLHTGLYKDQIFPNHRAFSYALKPKGNPQKGVLNAIDEITVSTKDHNKFQLQKINREEYEKLGAGLSRELVVACVRLQSTIDALCQRNTQLRNDEDTLKKGRTLFERLVVQTYDTTTMFSFPPTRCLDKYIVQLSSSFVAVDPAQTKTFLDLILKSPRLLPLLASVFNPNILFKEFPTLLKTLMASNINDDDMECLLRSFKVDLWLSTDPPETEQKNLLLEFGSRTLIYNSPKYERPSAGLWKLILNGFSQIAYRDNMSFAIDYVLNKSKDRSISEDVWGVLYEFFDNPSRIKNQNSIPSLLEWIAGFVIALRKTRFNDMSLYAENTWNRYTKPYFRLIHKLFSIWRVDPNGDLLKCQQECFVIATKIMSPWLTQSPWNNIPEELSLVSHVLESFISIMSELQHKMNGFEFMHSLWEYVIQLMDQDPLIQARLHLHLKDLPWKFLFPSLEMPLSCLELALKYQANHPQYDFLVQLYQLIPWNKPHVPSSNTQAYFGNLLKLFVNIVMQHPYPMNVDFIKYLYQIGSSYAWLSILSPTVFDYPNSFLLKDVGLKIQAQPEAQWRLGIGAEPETISTPEAQTNAVLRFLRILVTSPLKTPEEAITFDIQVRGYLQMVASLLPQFFTPSLSHMVVQDLLGIVSLFIFPMDRYALQDYQNRTYSSLLGLLSEITMLFDGGLSRDRIYCVETPLCSWLDTHPFLGHLVLRAAQISIREQDKQVVLTEKCLISDFYVYGQWSRLLSLLLVGDIRRQEFLDRAVESASLITLYTYVCQAEDRQPQLLPWLKRIVIKPRSESEWKVLLLWEKVIAFHFWNATRNIKKSLSELESLAKDLILHANDVIGGLKIPVFGMGIGGQTSAHSVQFRLIARILGVFILCQLHFVNNSPVPTGIRLRPQDPMLPSPLANSEIYNLTWLSKQTEYKDYDSIIKDMLVYIKEKTLNDIHGCILLLFKRICVPQSHPWQTPVVFIQKMFDGR